MKSMNAKERLKKLRNFKVYDKKIFSDLNKSEVKEELRLAKKRNQIVWLDDREFYKRPENYWNKEIGYRLSKRKFAKRMIKSDDIPVFKELFWSNRKNKFEINRYICIVMYRDSMMDIGRLRAIFGDKSVYKNYLEKFRNKNHKLEMYEECLEL